MEGCVPDSSKYVPGRGVVQVKDVVAPAATCVENDCTRLPCVGGTPTPVNPAPGASPAMGHVSGWALVWFGLGVDVAVVPRPPPNCPTIVSEVGTVFPFRKARLFVRLICRVCPVGTVMITGDQVPAAASGFRLAHVAVDVTPTARAVQE